MVTVLKHQKTNKYDKLETFFLVILWLNTEKLNRKHKIVFLLQFRNDFHYNTTFDLFHWGNLFVYYHNFIFFRIVLTIYIILYIVSGFKLVYEFSSLLNKFEFEMKRIIYLNLYSKMGKWNSNQSFKAKVK